MEWQIYRAIGVHEHENNVRDHFYCIKEIFELYNTKEKLETLAKRPDLDTICAFDYHKMKTYALSDKGLRYEDFQPEATGVKIPHL
jgi:hypothetical protein